MRRFAEANSIPMLLTWKTIDCLGHDHPLNFGSPGIMGCRTANFIVQNCDLLLIVGSRLEPSVTAFDSAAFGRNAKKVMVDVDEAEIRKIKGVDVPVVADAGDFLRALCGRQAEVETRDRSSWLAYCRRLRGALSGGAGRVSSWRTASISTRSPTCCSTCSPPTT